MGFQIPQDIESLSSEDLDKALDEAAKEFEPLGKLSNDEIDDEQADRMAALADFATAAKAKKEADAAAFAERNAKIDEFRRSFITEDKEDAEEGEEGSTEEAPAEAEAPAEVPAEEVAEEPAPVIEEVVTEEVIAEVPAVEAEEELPSDEDAEEDEKEKEKDAVVASGKSSIAETAKNAPKPEQVEDAPKSVFSLTAAADVPTVPAGKAFNNLKEAAAAITSRINSMPRGAKNTFSRQGALVFTRENTNGLSQENVRDDLELLLAAGAESRLQGGSLVAAGGWAAPSEILMDFCDIESTEGLIDLPEVSVTRGGLQYTKGPTFESVLKSSTGFWDMTEAVAEAGTELKTALRPEVPPFTEKRLDAVGVMVEAGLLTRAGWPELVERYAKLALLAHEVKMHVKKIQGIYSYTGAAKNVTNGFGNALDVLHVIDVVAAGERQRYSLGNSATLEGLAPVWTRNVIRADLANRNGVDFLSITDAQIDAYFSARGVRMQWLSHWQELDLATNGIATKYPDTLEIVMYPAGTYVAGTSDVISLDTVYDSVNLKKNDYVHLFVEQGLAVTNPCNDGRRFTIDFKATGTTGAANIENALFRAPVGP